MIIKSDSIMIDTETYSTLYVCECHDVFEKKDSYELRARSKDDFVTLLTDTKENLEKILDQIYESMSKGRKFVNISKDISVEKSKLSQTINRLLKSDCAMHFFPDVFKDKLEIRISLRGWSMSEVIKLSQIRDSQTDSELISAIENTFEELKHDFNSARQGK